MRGRMSGQDLALSEYELARLERIKENQRMVMSQKKIIITCLIGLCLVDSLIEP